MRSRWLLVLVALVALGVAVTGCGGDNDGATTTSGAPPAQVVTLKYADQNPATGWEGTQAAQPWLAQIEAAAGGRVKIESYPGQTLFKGVDTWESLKSGVGDFAWSFHGYWAGMTPLADVVALPFLSAAQREEVWT